MHHLMGAAVEAIDAHDTPVLALHHGGDGGRGGVDKRMAGERKGGDKCEILQRCLS